MSQAKEMARIAYDALEAKKGIDIRMIDISQVSVIADYFIIATGSSNNQVGALVEHVEEQMHKNGFSMKQREGGGNSPWVLLDYADIIVHVFEKESRSFYNAFCGAQRPQMRFRAAALRSKTATRLMQVISC